MSESVEMYLITTARLSEATGQKTVPLSQIAKALSVLPVSANQMVRKIAKSGLVEYIPYKGVKLTSKGKKIALNVLRKRRLWGVFLVERLGMPAEEADALACRMEHITPDDVADRLSTFLGHPLVSPRGKPIQRPRTARIHPTKPLSRLTIGCRGKVVSVDAEETIRMFLKDQGIYAGAEVRMLAMSGNGAVLLQVGDQQIMLAGAIASRVAVEASREVAGSAQLKVYRERRKTHVYARAIRRIGGKRTKRH